MTVTVRDVGPRDGLQNESVILPASTRAELVDRLVASGIKRVEVVSFVSAEAVPQMAEAELVVSEIARVDDVSYSGLVLNERGYDRLAETDLDEVTFAFAATETFNRRNQNASVGESVAAAERIAGRARIDGRRSSVVIGAAFGCPFEGPVDQGFVLELAVRLAAAQVDEITLGDTIGVAVPSQVRQLASDAADLGPAVAVHLHNTRNTGYANAYAALEAGVTRFDASIGGLGGCPFAPDAAGNIATEDLLYMLMREGHESGVNLDGLIGTAEWLETKLGHELPGQLHRAGMFDVGSLAMTMTSQ